MLKSEQIFIVQVSIDLLWLFQVDKVQNGTLKKKKKKKTPDDKNFENRHLHFWTQFSSLEKISQHTI